MEFEDRIDGEYQIRAGSLEIRAGEGFLAAVIVERARNCQAGTSEVYRDIGMSGGHCWPTSDQALKSALARGAWAVVAERARIAGRSAGLALAES